MGVGDASGSKCPAFIPSLPPSLPFLCVAVWQGRRKTGVATGAMTCDPSVRATRFAFDNTRHHGSYGACGPRPPSLARALSLARARALPLSLSQRVLSQIRDRMIVE